MRWLRTELRMVLQLRSSPLGPMLTAPARELWPQFRAFGPRAAAKSSYFFRPRPRAQSFSPCVSPMMYLHEKEVQVRLIFVAAFHCPLLEWLVIMAVAERKTEGARDRFPAPEGAVCVFLFSSATRAAARRSPSRFGASRTG